MVFDEPHLVALIVLSIATVAFYCANRKSRAAVDQATLPLKAPETRWKYSATDLIDFRLSASTYQAGLGRTALDTYRSRVLWLDIAFAISLALFGMTCWVLIAQRLTLPVVFWVALVCGLSAFLYGVFDVAEDVHLRKLLRPDRTISDADAAKSVFLTRLKFATICVSVFCVLLFGLLTLVDSKTLWTILKVRWRLKNTLLLRIQGRADKNHLFDAADVLLDELKAVISRRAILNSTAKKPRLSGPLRRAEGSYSLKLQRYNKHVAKLKTPLSALALSGGGIRSAAFALGVVEGLAARGLLQKFDYLSTVSGGGYLGSFLTAWVQRSGYERVCKDLTGKFDPNDRSPLQYLRRYTAYLTPRKGPFTADTLTVVAHYVRNLLLNWLIIIPLVACILIAIKLFAGLIWSIPASSEAVSAFGVVAIALIGIATTEGLRQRPGWQNSHFGVRKFQLNVKWLLFLGGLAASCAALKFSQLPGTRAVGEGKLAQLLHLNPGMSATVVAVAVLVAAIMFISWMFAFFIAHQPSVDQVKKRANVRSTWVSATISLLSFSFAGAVAGAALGALFHASSVWQGDPQIVNFMLLCLGPPIVITASFLGETFYVGLVGYMKWADSEREWVATAAGYHGRIAMTWMLVAAIVFGGSYVVIDYYNKSLQEGSVFSELPSLAAVGGASGIIVALLGRASSTAANMRERYNTWKNLGAAIVLAIAAPVFIVISVSMLSAAIDLFVTKDNDLIATKGRSLLFPFAAEFLFAKQDMAGAALVENRITAFYASVMWPLTKLLLTVGSICLLASWMINTNRFSLHGLYRNRLIRAFLGASRASDDGLSVDLVTRELEDVAREPDSLTGFDEKDNIEMCRLWPNKIRADVAIPPQLLVVNCSLNILASSELSWQERKALSFTATPRSAGAGALDSGKGHFRRSDEYSEAISLGGAITISGAAVSPNMGYHSSSALSLLLTFFNVRLGAWLGNPGPTGVKVYKRPGPVFSTMPLIQEAFGLTTEDGRYVYLSDGGHFENLGLYEMVRRRCGLIILSDAGCDESMTFEDLGNAVRKISIDLNVKIEFDSLSIGTRASPTGVASAVATITYPEPNLPKGRLLYLKPTYLGAEPASIRSYASKNPAFPHEPTSDQLFGESQFEAYRALGEYVVQTAVDNPTMVYNRIEDFIDDAGRRLARKSKSK
jgi:hypothetical protein